MAGPDDVCQVVCIHEDQVLKLRQHFIEAKLVQGVTDIFKALGDPTRARIVYALTQAEELCVCDLSALLGMSISAVSHQLRLLRNLRLVKYRKAGKVVYYSLDDDHVVDLFRQGLEHARHAQETSYKSEKSGVPVRPGDNNWED